MKSIGFIDYYLDEWHSNNYPKWIEDATGGEYKVSYAYGKIDSPLPNPMTNKEWAQKNGIQLLSSIEEVVNKSDCLIVLSPDNSEMHEELCKIPLSSGKPTYVDKTFADSKEIAIRLFEIADKNKTPVFSSSALRYATEYDEFANIGVDAVYSFGGGSTFDKYIIHQLEPVYMLVKSNADKVMYTSFKGTEQVVIKWSDGKISNLTFDVAIPSFCMNVKYEEKFESLKVESDMFKFFIKAMVKFFNTGVAPIKAGDTIALMAIREAMLEAKLNPDCWIKVK